jgi:hypothetical protein
MIDELARLIPSFPGAKNRTRCFTHIINIVVKRVLALFDDDSEDSVANTEKCLQTMAGDIDFDGAEVLDDELGPDGSATGSIDNELTELCEDGPDFETVRAAILPVRAVIAKVSRQIKPICEPVAVQVLKYLVKKLNHIELLNTKDTRVCCFKYNFTLRASYVKMD